MYHGFDIALLLNVTSFWKALAAAGLVQIVSIMIDKSYFLSRAFAFISLLNFVPYSFFHLLGFRGSSCVLAAPLSLSVLIEWPR